MTDKQRLAMLNSAIADLKLTKVGYPPKLIKGTHWADAMGKLNKLAVDLKPDPVVPVPALGPVWVGGKSVLLHDLTHATSGIPLYPAFDDAFVEGREIIAPENMTVSSVGSSTPGMAFYTTGESHIKYWFGHLDRTHSAGKFFRKGAVIGRVARNNVGGGPHVHVGINVEELFGRGKQLIHHTNYTHGAPLIGVQLKKGLAA